MMLDAKAAAPLAGRESEYLVALLSLRQVPLKIGKHLGLNSGATLQMAAMEAGG